jgi:type IV pilus assembly protein PilA
MLKRLYSRGFTLIELLVVIVIIAILMAIAIPAYLAQQTKAQDTKTKTYLNYAYRDIRSSLPEANNFFQKSTSLVNVVSASEPQLSITSGDCAGGLLGAAADALIVDSATTPNSLSLCAKSKSGNLWRLVSTPSGQHQVIDGSAIPFSVSGSEITDATRTASLAGDGLVNDSSTGIWESATNLIRNGGGELNNNNFLAANGIGAISAPDNAHAKFGTYSIRYDAPGTQGMAAGIYQSTAAGLNSPATTPYSCEFWSYGANGKAMEGLLRFIYTDTSQQDFTSNFTGSLSWQHISVANAPSAGGKTVDRVECQLRPQALAIDSAFGAWTAWVDGMQIEQKTLSTPYVETSGVTATRLVSRVQAPSSLLNANQGWFAARVRMGWSAASATGLFPSVAGWATNNNDRLGIIWNGGASTWVMDRRLGGIAADASTPVQNHLPGTIVTLIGYWSGATLGISINGSSFVTANDPRSLTPTSTNFDIGSNGTGAGPFNGDILWFAAGTGTLTNGDATNINGFGNSDPKPSSFSSSAAATFTWDGITSIGSIK